MAASARLLGSRWAADANSAGVRQCRAWVPVVSVGLERGEISRGFLSVPGFGSALGPLRGFGSPLTNRA